MKRLFTALALCLCAWAALAAQLDDGVTAAKRGDYATALGLWRPLADQGDALAQSNLGVMYSEGHGVPQDYAEAVKWYRKAADQGNAPAQYGLGLMYDEGHGVPQDYAEAMKWYRKAADQGDALAQNNLGLMYGRGQGVPQDNQEAVRLLQLAAAQGKVPVKRNYASCSSGFWGADNENTTCCTCPMAMHVRCTGRPV